MSTRATIAFWERVDGVGFHLAHDVMDGPVLIVECRGVQIAEIRLDRADIVGLYAPEAVRAGVGRREEYLAPPLRGRADAY